MLITKVVTSVDRQNCSLLPQSAWSVEIISENDSCDITRKYYVAIVSIVL